MGYEKPIEYIDGLPKRGVWTVYRIKRGLSKKERMVFLRVEGLIPQCTLCITGSKTEVETFETREHKYSEGRKLIFGISKVIFSGKSISNGDKFQFLIPKTFDQNLSTVATNALEHKAIKSIRQ